MNASDFAENNFLTMRRTPGQIALAVIYALLALNAWAQVVLVPLGRSHDPPILTALQVLIGAASVAAMWGSWRRARWAPHAAVVHGLITGGMLASLGAILDLPHADRRGLYIGAGAVVLWDSVFAWYLYRITTRRRVS